ncbi:unnamed protein product [Ceutorhynchus assimilis]|uniref:Histone deacetylase complex subunit SAP130 C-terminal domain-containing protein n=1 Tax=Ceutorhynchus assimilis TaxID=467358 RepID=A0A9N9MM87_9CUCU|nr:unnamed protein product [Ceutorhynchus assimilis]
MSANVDEDKEPQKALPLDLARTQITTVRTVESNKAPLVMSSQALRNVRVLQGVNAIPASVGQTIITNLVPGTMIKQDTNRTQITGIVSQSQPQSGGITIQRPTQITLSATPLVSAQSPPGTSYHVPRGPAVVANLAAPRSNVTTIRTPLVVTAQNTQTFVRPPRTPSPAQAWLTTNNTNGGQIKGTPAVLGSPIRGPTVTGKPQTVIGRPQSQQLPTIRGTILSNAITIGQTLHSFKPASGTIQLGGTVTVAQMLPARTQPVVYSTNTGAQFTPTARLTLATTSPGQMKPGQPRPMGNIVSGARLTVPLSQVQAAQNTRMVAPGTLRTTQPQVLTTGARIVTSQPSGNLIGRISTANVTNPANILTSQARISTLSTLNIQSLMAVANGTPARLQQTSQGPKVITQPAATIHLTPIPSQIKTTPPIPIVTSGTRTINVPASIVAQRPLSGGAISIAKVFTTENPSAVPGTTSVFIHAPLQAPRLPVPSPQNAPTSTPHQQQLITSVASTQGPTYPLTAQEGTTGYFYESPATPTGAFQRAFVSQHQNSFIAQPSTQPQSQPQIIRPTVPVCNQQFQGMRFNSVMVVEQSRAQQSTAPFQPIVTPQVVAESQTPVETTVQQQQPTAQNQNKATSSPRPSILRKRDHEGAPMKAAKNLMQALQTAPPSPPSPPRPDSRDNGHSSGSTTISATSSPGLGEINEDSNPLVAMNAIKEEEEEDVKPALEMSPRKKPRKQQLTTNSKNDTALNHGDMQFISENNASKKENNYDSDDEPYSDSVQKNGGPEPRIATLRKPASFTLLNGYRQNWKATHNHYQRYSDVKPKEDKRPSIIDLANQNRVLEKINGWKVYHLSTQMDDLAQQEHSVYDQLTDLLKFTESEETSRHGREVNTVNELIKGNLQRIKIINDGMLDAKCQIMKVFEHQRHVNDILSRCARTRNFKKREKS